MIEIHVFFWNINGAECVYFDGDIFKVVFETFLYESRQVSSVGFDLYIKFARSSEKSLDLRNFCVDGIF